jgi:hypothetical protein
MASEGVSTGAVEGRAWEVHRLASLLSLGSEAGQPASSPLDSRRITPISRRRTGKNIVAQVTSPTGPPGEAKPAAIKQVEDWLPDRRSSGPRTLIHFHV